MSKTQYKVRFADDSDKQRWDDYVTSHPATSPYHLFAWKKAIEEAYRHKAYYLIAEKRDKIVGIFPLIHFHLPVLLNELNALPFCDVGNLICENEEIAQLLINECLLICNKKKGKKIHLRGELNLPAAQEHIFTLDQNDKVRMFLELPNSSEALINGFKSKLRSQIRKAEKNGLFFSWGTKTEVDGYYAVFSENMRDLGSPVHSKEWFTSILSHYGGHAKLGIVKHEKEIVGGCILLTVKDKIAIPWASTLRKYNRLAPNMLLYWNVLKYAADAGFSVFDFGRSSEGEGTYKFKKQWGATPIPLKWYSFTPSSGQASSTDKITNVSSKQKIAEIWSKFPLPLANFLGPIIRRYISL